MENDNWNWSIENGLAVLREPFRPDTRYNEESINAAVSNVKANRMSYATFDAWHSHLRKFVHGAALFKKGS